MKLKLTTLVSGYALFCMAVACNQPSGASTEAENAPDANAALAKFGGFPTQVAWGENLVKIGGCNDCHTPKKMGPNGPENDLSLMLSGHPSEQPPPSFDVSEAAKKGLVVTQSFTAWTGPWGITYAANLTPDPTGIGNWKEEQFIKCLREKKWMGLENTRPLMPPMSMMPVTEMTEGEMKAVFAYLKTIPAIKNIQPDAMLLPPPAQ